MGIGGEGLSLESFCHELDKSNVIDLAEGTILFEHLESISMLLIFCCIFVCKTFGAGGLGGFARIIVGIDWVLFKDVWLKDAWLFVWLFVLKAKKLASPTCFTDCNVLRLVISNGPNGSVIEFIFHGSFCDAFLLDITKKSKSSSKALSVWDVFPLLVNADGFEFPSLPKLSMLTPSLLDRVVNVGDPGGLKSIKQIGPFVFSDCNIVVCIWLFNCVMLECSLFFLPKKLVKSSVGLTYSNTI